MRTHTHMYIPAIPLKSHRSNDVPVAMSVTAHILILGLLGTMVDFRSRTRKVQGEPKTILLCQKARKCSKTNGTLIRYGLKTERFLKKSYFEQLEKFEYRIDIIIHLLMICIFRRIPYFSKYRMKYSGMECYNARDIFK